MEVYIDYISTILELNLVKLEIPEQCDFEVTQWIQIFSRLLLRLKEEIMLYYTI